MVTVIVVHPILWLLLKLAKFAWLKKELPDGSKILFFHAIEKKIKTNHNYFKQISGQL